MYTFVWAKACQRIRAGGSGIAAVLSDICYAEALNQPVETMRWQNQDYFIEPALTADDAIAYIRATPEVRDVLISGGPSGVSLSNRGHFPAKVIYRKMDDQLNSRHKLSNYLYYRRLVV